MGRRGGERKRLGAEEGGEAVIRMCKVNNQKKKDNEHFFLRLLDELLNSLAFSVLNCYQRNCFYQRNGFYLRQDLVMKLVLNSDPPASPFECQERGLKRSKG